MWYAAAFFGCVLLFAWALCRAAARGDECPPDTLTFVGGEKCGQRIPDLHGGVITSYQWGPDRYTRVGNELVLVNGALARERRPWHVAKARYRRQRMAR